LVRYERRRNGLGVCTKVEAYKTVFLLDKGVTLKNVVLGAKSIEHVHCESDRFIVENVWKKDAYEDALTFEYGTSISYKFYVKGGGPKNKSDKITKIILIKLKKILYLHIL